MRKVVLNCPDEKTLRSISSDLRANGIAHKLWIESPESIPTCIATMVSESIANIHYITILIILKPSYRSTLAPHFKMFRLFC